MTEVIALIFGALIGVLVTSWAAVGQYDKGWDDAASLIRNDRSDA